MPEKEAVVILLDAASTMSSTFLEDPVRNPLVKNEDDAGEPDGDQKNASVEPASSLSLLEASKTATQMLIIDLMSRSKTHEASVIVLKTKDTSHHLMEECDEENEILFPNLTELPLVGLNRPTKSLLRLISEIHTSTGVDVDDAKKHFNQEEEDEDGDNEETRGDFCDGLIVAADIMKRRTDKKKYSRRIILITDAKHKVIVDEEQLAVLLESLAEMNCKLQVIVWNPANLDEPPKSNNETHGDVKVVKLEPKTEDGESAAENGDNEEDDNDIKRQNEKLLFQMARGTPGGFVVGVSSMSQVLDAMLSGSCKKVHSVRNRCEFHIAPGMVLCSTRYALIMQKATAPTLKTEAVMIDDDTQQPVRNGLGDELTYALTRDYKHLDPDDPELVLEDGDRTSAYRFGNDYIPIGKIDLAGLTTLSPCCIRILGYVDASVVPRHLVVGPPYIISGDTSRRDCAAISALAQGLHNMDHVAICTFVKKANKDPILAGLFPHLDPCPTTNKTIYRLILFQLPFAGEVQRFELPSLDEHVNNNTSSSCEDLIDALMLGDDDLVCDNIPNPYTRLYNKTIGERAANPSSTGISSLRSIGQGDAMSTPQHILDKAAPFVQAFYDQFPLEALSPVESSASSKRGAKRGAAANKKRKGPVSARDFM